MEELSTEPSLDSYLTNHSEFVVFTHAARTRSLALGMLTTYFVMFVFFVRFIRRKLEGLENMPEFLAVLSDPETTRLTFYLGSAAGLIFAVAILLYFLWTVVDIWGLQVCVSPVELRVQNTITGLWAPKLTGVGSLDMKQIDAIKGGGQFTRVAAGKHEVRFSPVDRLDLLITTIMRHAPGAVIEEQEAS